MTVRVGVAPALLRWATQRAGWDEATAAQKEPNLELWVAGDKLPTLKQLESFARKTHAPFGMLFLAEPPQEEVPLPDMRTMGNAAVAQPSGDLLDTIYLCQERQAWYREYLRELGVDGPTFFGTATTRTPVIEVATQIRTQLGFGIDERSRFRNWQEALRRLIDYVENLGVLVMVSGVVGANSHRRLNPEEFRGFALADPVAPLIFVNGADTKAAQLFTLIHELGHLWLGTSALSDASMHVQASHADELWCNKVAAEVLVPVASLRDDYHGDPTTDELERLSQRYRASTLVVLKRIFDAGYLTWDEYSDRYSEELGRVIEKLAGQRAGGQGGNYYYTQPLRLSQQFARSVIASTFQGSTMYREAFQLLGVRGQSTFTELATKLGAA